MKLVFLEATMLVVQETWFQKIKTKKMMNTLTIRQKKDKIDSQPHEEIRKILLFKKNH